ncbi:MAG: hypothetical protein HY053_08255, partial [Proteobacteria bacterium]|nr:hypothetical protein [Pseudomonadota bacterium]
TFSLATRMKSISAEQLIREGFLSVFDLKNKTQERRARKSLQRALISLSGFSTSLINAVEKHRKKPVAPEGDLTQAELQARQDVLDRIKAEADARLAAEADRQAREAIIAEGHAREQRMRLAREARLARERQEREALDRARAELAARQAGKPRRVTQADLDEREARRRNARSRWEQRRPRRRPDDANND